MVPPAVTSLSATLKSTVWANSTPALFQTVITPGTGVMVGTVVVIVLDATAVVSAAVATVTPKAPTVAGFVILVKVN
jgi:hypothetical protein